MHYYKLALEDRRGHDALLKDTLEAMLQVFRDYTGADSTVAEYTVEELVCSLAGTLEENVGQFVSPPLNDLYKLIILHVGAYKQMLYADTIPEDFPTYLQLVDQCIGLLKGGEGQAVEEDRNSLYEMLFVLGEARCWVANITDADRAFRMRAMLDSRLRAMYDEGLLDEYYVNKLTKGIMTSDRTVPLFVQMETVIDWLTLPPA